MTPVVIPRDPRRPGPEGSAGMADPSSPHSNGAPRDDKAVALAVLFGLALSFVACGAGAPEPAPLDTRNEQCASCRMAVSNARFSSQLVAPGELPRFFDDLGCLADFLKAGKAPAGAVAFVADHRTKAWVRADRAVYTKVPGLETPMGSHVIAHADAASRNGDVDARAGTPVSGTEVFGPVGPPVGGAE
jgi:copper chaperone NosL